MMQAVRDARDAWRLAHARPVACARHRTRLLGAGFESNDACAGSGFVSPLILGTVPSSLLGLDGHPPCAQ
jgi:hypothetical protein